jgi:hypothetical protein
MFWSGKFSLNYKEIWLQASVGYKSTPILYSSDVTTDKAYICGGGGPGGNPPTLLEILQTCTEVFVLKKVSSAVYVCNDRE